MLSEINRSPQRFLVGDVVSTQPWVEGLGIYPLKQIKDNRGSVMHFLRKDAPHFKGFGEVYLSTVKTGVVKAWKKHREMTQNFVVPVGLIKLVIYDGRPNSTTHGITQEILTGSDNYGLIQIPPLVWYGFKGISAIDSLIVNCATILHHPDEMDRADTLPELPNYSW